MKRRTDDEKPLGRYNTMRDFGTTAEPHGKVRPTTSGNSYVIQKHAATALHYDFRLELDGVLLSWAVPKGPSLSTKERRLAVQTEDHPVDYRDFEGTIPKGAYGGGAVSVWDRGTWEPVGDPREGMRKGKLEFLIHGEKLRGKFRLVRLAAKDGDRGKKNWLLMKGTDEHARIGHEGEIVKRQPGSVLTGRTIEDLKNGAPANAKMEKAVRIAKRKAISQTPPPIPRRGATKLTHPERIVDVETGTTKGDMARYVEAVAPQFLAFAAKRPLMLVRCTTAWPASSASFGSQGRKPVKGSPCFVQKHAGLGLTNIGRQDVGTEEVIYVTKPEQLCGLVQLNAFELHGWGARLPRIEKPDWIVLDLDPDDALPFARVVDAALELRDELRKMNLASFVKTTGGKGLHVVVPLTPREEWPVVSAFAAALAQAMAKRSPEKYVATMAKAARKGKIFVDHFRNARGATAILPYSPRARTGAPVAMPVAWKDLARVDPGAFDVRNVPAMLSGRRIDPWAELWTTKQLLPRVIADGLRRASG